METNKIAPQYLMDMQITQQNDSYMMNDSIKDDFVMEDSPPIIYDHNMPIDPLPPVKEESIKDVITVTLPPDDVKGEQPGNNNKTLLIVGGIALLFLFRKEIFG
jgi:hypothetical protein